MFLVLKRIIILNNLAELDGIGTTQIESINHFFKNEQNIKTILIRKETPIHKIIKLPKLIFEIYKYSQFSCFVLASFIACSRI